MRWPGPRSQSRAMNTNTVNPEAPTTATNTGQSDSRPEQRYGFDLGRTGLRRPFQDRMLAGVSAGLARYFDVDVTIVRIAFVVLDRKSVG